MACFGEPHASRTASRLRLCLAEDLMRRLFRSLLCAAAAGVFAAAGASAQSPSPSPAPYVLFENVRVFDGRSDRLSEPTNVMVVGNVIRAISAEPIAPPADAPLTRIAGGGRTLMPGLIDAHAHVTFANVTQIDTVVSDVGYLHIAAGRAAEAMLLSGYTAIRDMGGPAFGV